LTSSYLLTTFNQTSNIKLHLILLASVFNLSSGFRAEVRGSLGEETYTGDEYADFRICVMQAGRSCRSKPSGVR
jgi:hypothetical protein